MKNIVCLVIVLGIFLFGYLVMARFDKFIDENREYIKSENEKKEPFCIMLTEQMTEEEIDEEVRNFKKKQKTKKYLNEESKI